MTDGDDDHNNDDEDDKIKECATHGKTKNIAFNTLLCSLLPTEFCESNSSKTVRKKKQKTCYSTWPIHSTRVPRIHHTVSIHGP